MSSCSWYNNNRNIISFAEWNNKAVTLMEHGQYKRAIPLLRKAHGSLMELIAVEQQEMDRRGSPSSTSLPGCRPATVSISMASSRSAIANTRRQQQQPTEQQTRSRSRQQQEQANEESSATSHCRSEHQHSENNNIEKSQNGEVSSSSIPRPISKKLTSSLQDGEHKPQGQLLTDDKRDMAPPIFLYRKAIRILSPDRQRLFIMVDQQQSQKESYFYIWSIVVLYNLGLAYQQLAYSYKENTTNATWRRRLLKESLKLYQATLILKNQGRIRLDTNLLLSVVNNTVPIQMELGRFDKVRKLQEFIMSTIMMVVDYGQSSSIPEMDNFLRTAFGDFAQNHSNRVIFCPSRSLAVAA